MLRGSRWLVRMTLQNLWGVSPWTESHHVCFVPSQAIFNQPQVRYFFYHNLYAIKSVNYILVTPRMVTMKAQWKVLDASQKWRLNRGCAVNKGEVGIMMLGCHWLSGWLLLVQQVFVEIWLFPPAAKSNNAQLAMQHHQIGQGAEFQLRKRWHWWIVRQRLN